MSGEVVVRPDGRIALPLINEVVALGKTPAELREVLTTLAAKFIADPNVSVGVRQINSRKVSITGMVLRGGPYALGGPMTVLQLIAAAGGLQEVRQRQEHRDHPDPERQVHEPALQLQRRQQGQEPAPEHRVDARGHGDRPMSPRLSSRSWPRQRFACRRQRPRRSLWEILRHPPDSRGSRRRTRSLSWSGGRSEACLAATKPDRAKTALRCRCPVTVGTTTTSSRAKRDRLERFRWPGSYAGGSGRMTYGVSRRGAVFTAIGAADVRAFVPTPPWRAATHSGIVAFSVPMGGNLVIAARQGFRKSPYYQLTTGLTVPSFGSGGVFEAPIPDF